MKEGTGRSLAHPRAAGKWRHTRWLPPDMATEAQIRYGEIMFIEQCSRCHVFGPSVTPDLRKLPLEAHDPFRDIVFNGALASRGRERFGDFLSEADFDAIQAYLVDQTILADAVCHDIEITRGFACSVFGKTKESTPSSILALILL